MPEYDEKDDQYVRACPLSEVKTAALFGIAPSSVGRIKRREVWNG